MQKISLKSGVKKQLKYKSEMQCWSTWFSIHFSPNAAVHSFFAALVNQSKVHSLSSVPTIDKISSRLSILLNISPFELMLGWVLNYYVSTSLSKSLS
jgi:hypothetical protein